MSKTNKSSVPGKAITPSDVSRIQGAVAQRNGGATPKGSYVGRIQRHVANQTKPAK